jgi:hypothetical protein
LASIGTPIEEKAMNVKSGYELHIEARRERAALQGELLARFVTGLSERARCGWFNVSDACRRRLRAFRIAEA